MWWWFLARGLNSSTGVAAAMYMRLSSTSIAATRMYMQLLEPHLTDLNVLVFLNRFGKRVLWQYNTVLLGQNARMSSRECKLTPQPGFV